jgi:glycosyltransferase involved in cell wall biosynthesis
MLLPPDDDKGWARAMAHLAASEELRQSLRESGKLRVRRFSWRNTAEKTWMEMEVLLRRE